MSKPEERWMKGYKTEFGKKIGPWSPMNYEILKDVIDSHLHIHDYMGYIDEVELAKRACDAGMKALVFKSSRHGIAAAETARFTQKAIDEYAKAKELRPINIFGGCVLSFSGTGGLNPEAIKMALELNLKVVWMPVFDAAGHLERTGMERNEAKRRGIYILKGGEIISAVEDVLNVVAEAGLAISCGHLSLEEIMVFIDSARSAGVKSVIVDHPNVGSMNATLEQQKEIARKGAYLNFCWTELDPMFSSMEIGDEINNIKEIGAEHSIACSDTGFLSAPFPMEALRMFIIYMKLNGLTQEEIDIMTKKNPARILGLEI